MRINTIIIMLLIFLPIVFAGDLVFKKGEIIDLKVPCINNNTLCSGTASCNITSIYPNGSILINNLQMSNSGSYHNYTIAGQ